MAVLVDKAMRKLILFLFVNLFVIEVIHAQDAHIIGVEEILFSQEENGFTCYQWNRPRDWGARRTIDTAYLSVTYNYTFPVKKGDGFGILGDMHILQLGRHTNRSYSAYCERIDSLAFHFLTGLDDQRLELIEFDWTPTRLQRILYEWIPQDICPLYQDVHTDLQTGRREVTTRFQYSDYQYIEDAEPMRWTFLPGTDTLLGRPCNRAETVFRGRKWTAWYTFDLPFSYGPWKFSGLPGLILKVTDDEGRFCWEAAGYSAAAAPIVEYVPGQSTDRRVRVWLPDYKIRHCTRAEMDLLWKRFWNAPLSIQVLDKMEAIFVDGNDKVVTVRVSDPVPDGFYPRLETDR